MASGYEVETQEGSRVKQNLHKISLKKKKNQDGSGFPPYSVNI
jgi:hypothetical protein